MLMAHDIKHLSSCSHSSFFFWPADVIDQLQLPDSFTLIPPPPASLFMEELRERERKKKRARSRRDLLLRGCSQKPCLPSCHGDVSRLDDFKVGFHVRWGWDDGAGIQMKGDRGGPNSRCHLSVSANWPDTGTVRYKWSSSVSESQQEHLVFMVFNNKYYTHTSTTLSPLNERILEVPPRPPRINFFISFVFLFLFFVWKRTILYIQTN